MSNVRFSYTNRWESVGILFLNGPAVVLGAINNCVNTVASITRGSGSYITDGVKRWSLLSGTIAARFPANTRVTNVAALTLTMSAAATSSTGGAEAATFTPTAPLVQDAGYPMSNALNAQRYTPWDPGAGAYPQTIAFEFDMVAGNSITLLALLGVGWDVLALQGISIARFYSGSSYGSWTLRSTQSPAFTLQRDFGAVIGSIAQRFWRVELDFDVRCTLGSIYGGIVDQDLGISIATGWGFRRMKPAVVQRTPAGSPIVTFLGDYERRHWTAKYDAITSTARGKLESTFNNLGIGGGSRRTPVMIDEEDAVYEVEFQDLELGWVKVFTNVDATAYEIESLP